MRQRALDAGVAMVLLVLLLGLLAGAADDDGAPEKHQDLGRIAPLLAPHAGGYRPRWRG